MLFDAEFIIYIDGASRGNPGESSYGFVIQDKEGNVLHTSSGYIGHATNNIAEYTALVKALEFAIRKKIRSIEIRSDSLLVVKQLLGEYKIKSPHLSELNELARARLKKFQWYDITHVPRSENKMADRLANQALDKHRKDRKEEQPADG